jgi:uncharacterized membrane protein (DUF4010 family)
LLSGVSDVDAITLSLSTLYTDEKLMLHTAFIGIVIATFSNSITKLVIAYTVGNRELGNQLFVAFGIPLAVIIIVLVITPLIINYTPVNESPLFTTLLINDFDTFK